jgi:hypothetical protein
METPLPSFFSIESTNSNKSCQYPFVDPLCTILESTLAINFNFKVDTIFVKKNFFEGGIIVIHCSSFLNGLFIFLLKPNLDSSFIIKVQSNHVHSTFPLESSPKQVTNSSSLCLGNTIPNEKVDESHKIWIILVMVFHNTHLQPFYHRPSLWG